ncbi:MAG: hypothetical protein K0Q91_2196 [Fibrobacteria bacterium]|jgi:hypothetical protein|nr:hypothetical protein [Fibrobacteria bacterium]
MRFVLAPVLWILKWMFGLALLCLAVAALRVSLWPLKTSGGWSSLARSPLPWVVLGGFATRRLLTLWRRGDPLELVDTLEHELTHAVVGTLTFAPPVSLTATLRGGGEVELRRSNPIAALAPYALPLFALALALLTLVLKTEWLGYGRLAVAFLLGSFAHRLLREFHFGQTDFREFGFVFSMVFIAAALPLCLLGVIDLARMTEVDWRHAGHLFVDQARKLAEALRQAFRR